MDDQRRQYRVEPGPRAEFIEVSLRRADGTTYHGKVIDTSQRGAAVVFRNADAPDLHKNDSVSLAFTLPDRPQPIVATAIAINGQASKKYHRYGFEFTDIEGLEQQISNESWAVFNRRAFRRLQLGTESHVKVTLRIDGSGLLIRGQLGDLSASGVCIVLEGDRRGELACGARIQASFTLPGTFSELEYTGSVSTERLEEGRTLIGFEFDVENTPNADAQREIIEEWLASFALETW